MIGTVCEDYKHTFGAITLGSEQCWRGSTQSCGLTECQALAGESGGESGIILCALKEKDLRVTPLIALRRLIGFRPIWSHMSQQSWRE